MNKRMSIESNLSHVPLEVASASEWIPENEIFFAVKGMFQSIWASLYWDIKTKRELEAMFHEYRLEREKEEELKMMNRKTEMAMRLQMLKSFSMIEREGEDQYDEP